MLKRSEAKDILEPYSPIIRECIYLGWNEYYTEYADKLHIHCPIARATTIRSHILHHVRLKFSGYENITFIEKGNLFILCIDWKIAIKFKKLNADFTTCNAPTKQSIDFIQQTLFEGLLINATHLHAGYMPNDLWTGLHGIYITCPNGNKIKWDIELQDANQLIDKVTEQLPLVEEGETVPNRVSIKKKEMGGFNETGTGSK